MTLVDPHGGPLVNRIVSGRNAEGLAAHASTLPQVLMDAREQADLELIATGAASPLTGFLGRADYEHVLKTMRLSSSVVWPLPFTLAVDPKSEAGRASAGQDVALLDATGRVWGVMHVKDVFDRDPLVEAQAIYGVTEPAHPGVAYLQSRPTHLLGGDVDVLPLPTNLPFADHRLTPSAMREAIAQRGWTRVAGFQTRNPIHRAHEYLTKIALEVTDGLVIHPLVGETKQDDVPAAVRFKAYRALLDAYYPKDRVLLAAFPAAMRYAGPREALFHAIVRKNYGITHLIVGRDHAGVGGYYPPFAAQQMFDTFGPDQIGVSPLRLDVTFFCRACDGMASARTCPHDPSMRVELSGSKVRALLASGGDLPREFSRPEVAAILREHYQKIAGDEPTASGFDAADVLETAQAPTTPATPTGAIVWFTGLSGAGKSTLATRVRERLIADGRRVEVLDGDDVRTHLSKGLGFSKADRDTNISRIAFVARLVAKQGSVAITAAISPYAGARADAKRLAHDAGLEFVEIFADASIDALTARDVKGLYKKALAGEIKNFTGVSDPYERPERPDLVVYTDKESVDESAARVIALLESRGITRSTTPGSRPTPRR